MVCILMDTRILYVEPSWVKNYLNTKKGFKKLSKVKAKPMVTENLQITRKKSWKVVEFKQLKRVQTP